MRRLVCLFILIMLCGACSNQGTAITCTLTIYNAEGSEIISTTKITCKEGQSVLDVLKKATRDAEIQMEYTGVGAAAYVKGIDNLYEFDDGPESGWIYSVNDEVIQESAGTYTLENGDNVVWQYVLTS